MKAQERPRRVELFARHLDHLFGPRKGLLKPAATPSARVEEVDPIALRRRLKLSQEAFARRYGLSLQTLQKWEQGLRRPGMTASSYLTVIARDPRGIAELLAGGRPAPRFDDVDFAKLRAALDAADRADPPLARKHRRRR
ncbi:MAG TPA: helix-turn-helix domain-containing protein [Stellaceae bacterium]|nr:helix-turn-helix domain-containing protein [Stellaceae bacterium]